MSTPRPEVLPTQPSASRARRLGIAGILVLFVLPLALRLRPVSHGMPRNYVPDTHMVRAALGMARDKDPVPPVNRYSSYPYLVPYMLLPLYAGQFALGLATGEWSGAADYGEAISADPSSVHLIARVLVALFGAFTPWVVFRTARAVGLGAGAWVAAWLVGTGLLHTHFSVQDRPWVPMVFFMALSAWPAALYVNTRRARMLVLAGLAAGLSLASHQAGLLALGIPALAWLQVALATRREGWKRVVATGFACVATFAVAALILGHPYYLVHGLTPEHAIVGGGEADLNLGGQSHNFGFRLASLAHLSRAFAGYDPALLALAIPGLFLIWRSRAAWPAALFALLWAGYFMPQENDHVRYLLPLSVLFALPAGFAAERWLARGPRAAWALSPLLAFPLVQDLRLGHVLSRPDTRATAERLVPPLLPTGARLAIDRYGPEFELSLGSLELLATVRATRGETLSMRESARAERLLAGGSDVVAGLDAVHVRELFDFDERDGTVAIRQGLASDGPYGTPSSSTDAELRAVLDKLGVTHLLVVSRAPRDPRGSLIAGLARGAEPLLVIEPALTGAQPVHTRLPLEMEFPLVSLWQVARPGPWMALYELP